jgi:pimeloyl-ACP methyl ester carboxylesterase
VSALRHATSADGTRIAYRVSGTGDPVLFVHGSGTSGADWLFALPFLRDRFTVVTMDRRGRGDSGDCETYAMEREVEDVLAVLEAVGAEILVGHSYGALCSAIAAGRTDRLRGLVLYEPPIAVRAEVLGPLNEAVAAGELDLALAGFLSAAGVRADELELIRSSGAWPVLLDAVPALPRELAAAAKWKHPGALIDVPTLFLIGGDTEAREYLDGLEDLLAAFPDLRREVIPGQQHIAHVLVAEQFAALVAGLVDSLG